MKILYQIGEYVILMFQAFKKPDKGFVFRRQLLYDFKRLGVDSISIISIISLFIGAIIAIQMAYNIDSPFIAKSIIGDRKSVV